MSIPSIILLLLATLTFFVVGAGVLARERDRRGALAFAIERDRPSAFRRFRDFFERRLRRTRSGRWLRRKLDQADVSWTVVDVVFVALAAGLLVGVVSYQVGGPVLALVVLVLLFLGVRAWLSRREEARFAAFINQLPDLARLLANAASAGLSLRGALLVAAQEMQEPTKGELEKVNEELAVGSSLDDALTRMGERLPSRELAVLVNVLVIQTRAGGRIVTALQGITEALIIRRDLRREVATLMAGSKATVFAVSGLGVLMVYLVHTAVEGGLRALLSDPIGIAIFVVSLGLYVFGLYLVRRAMKVEI